MLLGQLQSLNVLLLQFNRVKINNSKGNHSLGQHSLFSTLQIFSLQDVVKVFAIITVYVEKRVLSFYAVQRFFMYPQKTDNIQLQLILCPLPREGHQGNRKQSRYSAPPRPPHNVTFAGSWFLNHRSNPCPQQ